MSAPIVWPVVTNSDELRAALLNGFSLVQREESELFLLHREGQYATRDRMHQHIAVNACQTQVVGFVGKLADGGRLYKLTTRTAESPAVNSKPTGNKR